MYQIAAFLLLGSMALALTRALRGPTVFDRILAVNMFGTATVLMISVIGFMGTSRDLVDIALIYALVSFTGTIAVLRFVEYDAEQNRSSGMDAAGLSGDEPIVAPLAEDGIGPQAGEVTP